MRSAEAVRTLRALGATSAAKINKAAIIQEPSFRSACAQNRCGAYGTNWACPPASDDSVFRLALKEAAAAIVFQLCVPLSDPFDAAGMQNAQAAFETICAKAADLSEGRAFGTGPCRVCDTCAYPKPCRYPQRRRENLEAACVDVAALCREAGLRYAAAPPSVTFTGVLLLNEPV